MQSKKKGQNHLFAMFAKALNYVTIISLIKQMFFIFCAVRNIKNNSMKKFKLLISGLLLMGGGICAQNPVTVQGVVSDSEKNEPLVGASVVAGSGVGVSTLADGSYSIQVVPGTRLVYQFIGYETVEFICPMGSTTITHNVKLKSESQTLDDVVVVAYGVRKKGTVTGSVATVKAQKLENVPTAGFDQALQGQAPGLMVLSRTGEPSSPAVFRIRGTNSINSGKDPLFILDGVPIASSDFNAISPADIESISVLKDASSTSIYGARAANGVVVITTKRGRMAKDAQVTLRTQLGFSQLAHGNWNMMNTAERIQYEKEVGLDSGKDYARLSRINTNWINEVFRDNAFLQSYDAQVTGATDRINYYVSGGFYEQEGIATDSDFSRYSLRSNLDFRANKWLRVGTNTMLVYEQFSESTAGEYYTNTPISASRMMMPYWSPYKENGSLASLSDGSWKGVGENPLEWSAMNPYSTDKYKVLSTVFAEVSPVKGLTIRSNFGIDYTHQAAETTSFPSYVPNNNKGRAGRNSTDAMNLTISNTANYVFDVNNSHHFNLMLGQEGVSYKSTGFSVNTSGQNNDKLSGLGAGTTARSWSDASQEYAYLSFFARGEYNYESRYFVDFSIRGDGSSRFGNSNRWAAFWSMGFMWNLHNEKFMQNIRWLTNAQLAASTGTSGNSSIPNYEHLALVVGGYEYGGIAGIAPSSKGNENLAWEKTWTSNIALRLGFWNRMNVEVEFYNKKTTDMLMAVPVSYSDAGFGLRWDNVGAMVNRGVEFNINADVIRTKDFSWNVNTNASYNHNEIVELYNGLNEYTVSTTGMKLVVGHPASEFFLTRYAGVNAANGEQLWYTADGDITSEYSDQDKVMTGKSSNAPWMGGFGTTFSWRGLLLTAQFSWVADRWMINNDRYFEENSLFSNFNQSKRMLYDRWKKPGDITDIPRYGSTPQFDTHLLEDASFLRLKNVMLSYSLPKKLLSHTRFLTGVRIYAQAQNLFTFTDFSGLDPESDSNVYKAQYPMSRQFTFGAELTF